ncbi:MAG: PTS sugar transporter subunit IIA [Candidatus Auribacterota bacterium]|nr:PTS sugar transporter subunit IIA [Candidatus Auribacterota bacterium]
MKEIYNRLIQLQELYFAKEEHTVSGNGNNLKQLEKSISSLLKKLPVDTADFFQELQEQAPPALSPMIGETCYGCGIDLPTSLCTELLHLDKLYHCPNCARYLYPYQGEKLIINDDLLRRRLPQMGIERFSSEKLMIPRLQADTKEGIITELGELIANQFYHDDPQILIKNALEREAITSTAVEHGIAFPHTRGIDAGSLTVALGLKKRGLKFGAPKNHLTKIFFFIVIPISSSAFYLTLLAGLIESLSATENRKTLLSSKTQNELWENLKKLTEKHIP